MDSVGGPVAVLVHGRVYAFAVRSGDRVRLQTLGRRPSKDTVPWADVEAWAPRRTLRDRAKGSWQHGPAAIRAA
jgi:hypothetical protein